MRRLILIVPVLLLLGGCAPLLESVLRVPPGLLTESIQNPITKEHLYRLEQSLIAGVTVMQAYKNKCEDGTLASSCIARVAQMQAYVKKARPYLVQLRVFVRKNDQVNARVVYTTITGLLAEFRNSAWAAGLPIANMGV